MVPLGSPIEQTIDALATLLESGDIVVEGGNSCWTDPPRVARLAERGSVHPPSRIPLKQTV
jgi:6-phosphogluconate dehydrogenase